MALERVERSDAPARIRQPSGPSARREREILVGLARGRTNRELADDLIVSEATVKTHVSHLLTKLGVRSRVQAVVIAYEAGVVRPGERNGDDPLAPLSRPKE